MRWPKFRVEKKNFLSGPDCCKLLRIVLLVSSIASFPPSPLSVGVSRSSAVPIFVGPVPFAASFLLLLLLLFTEFSFRSGINGSERVQSELGKCWSHGIKNLVPLRTRNLIKVKGKHLWRSTSGRFFKHETPFELSSGLLHSLSMQHVGNEM